MITMLHNYSRSSTSFRVRIALAMKNICLCTELSPSAQGRAAQRRLSRHQSAGPGADPRYPWSSCPSRRLEYLKETHPEPPLLPEDAAGRARVRSLALMIACGIHPLGNLRVLADLRTRFGADDAAVADWFRHWVTETLSRSTAPAREPETGRFCHGDAPTFADICLVPQVINNKRFDVDMQPYPTIARICEACLLLPAFASALPERQPDAE